MSQRNKICPYCGETILQEARKCKHCKQWLDDNPKNQSSQSSNKTFWWGMIAFVSVMGLITVLAMNTRSISILHAKSQDTIRVETFDNTMSSERNQDTEMMRSSEQENAYGNSYDNETGSASRKLTEEEIRAHFSTEFRVSDEESEGSEGLE